MLDEYTAAFARYLRSGTVGALRAFCAEDADLARLRVYRNGFLRACIEALRASYPSVERLVGEDRFRTLARPYVEACPPRDPRLALYGEGFSQFIEGARDVHRLDHLASVAVLDRAWTEVHFSADDHVQAAPPAVDTPADAEALMNLRGCLAPWVRLLSLDFHALEVWSRLRQGEPGRRAEALRGPQHVLIWRTGAYMRYRGLTPPEYAFIAGVAAGGSCAEAAGAALALDAGFDLVATFASVLHHRILSFES